MSSTEKLILSVHKLLCAADRDDLLKELSKEASFRRRSVCRPAYSHSISTSVTWEQLQTKLDRKVSFCGSEADIEYLDDEGDLIPINSDTELQEALKLALRSDDKQLRLFLYYYKRKITSPKMQTEKIIEKKSSEKPKKEGQKYTCANRACTGYEKPVMVSTSATTEKQAPAEKQHPLLERPRLKEANLRRKRVSLETKLKHATSLYDSESGEKSGGKSNLVTETKEVPKWFINYMDTYKESLTTEIADKTARKTARRLAVALENLNINKKDTAEPGRSVQLRTPVQETGERKESPPTHRAICDGCDNSIVGIRYKCGNCLDYDLCEQCEMRDDVHDPDHVFLKVRRPTSAYLGGRKKGVMGPMLKRSIYLCDPIKEARQAMKLSSRRPPMTNASSNLVNLVEHIDLSEKYGNRHHHEKRTEKLKRRRDVQREAPYKKEKLTWETSVPMMRTDNSVPVVRVENGTISIVSDKEDDLDEYEVPVSTETRFREPHCASFICDDSIPDDTHLQPGTKFVKKWAIRNTGLRAWDENIKLTLLWGNLPTQTPHVDVPHLAPDERGVVSVDLVAPEIRGSYQNHWSLQVNGRCFGHRVWCSIVVDQREVLDGQKTPSLEIIDRSEYETILGDTETNAESGEVCIVKPQGTRNLTSDNLTFEVLKLDEDRVSINVPKMSQTATPNNTPLETSPPKSPAPELALATLRERSEKDCQDMSLLVQQKMERLVLKNESHTINVDLSDSDSDSDGNDFFLVPLPQCFDVSTPMMRSTIDTPLDKQDFDTCSEKSFDLVRSETSTSEEATALELEFDFAEAEIELQDMSDKRNSDTDTEEAIQETIDEEEETSCTYEQSLETRLNDEVCNTDKPEEKREVVRNEDSGEEVHCVDRSETVLIAPVPPEMHQENFVDAIEGDPNQTEVKRPFESNPNESNVERDENGEETIPRLLARQCSASSSIESVSTIWEDRGGGLEDLMNAAIGAAGTAANVAGSAASQAIHAARDVVSMIKQRNQYIPRKSTWAPAGQQTPQGDQWEPNADDQRWQPHPDDLYVDLSDDEGVYPVLRDPLPMNILLDMGFANREVNQRLLNLYDNDLSKVVTEILINEPELMEERH